MTASVSEFWKGNLTSRAYTEDRFLRVCKLINFYLITCHKNSNLRKLPFIFTLVDWQFVKLDW